MIISASNILLWFLPSSLLRILCFSCHRYFSFLFFFFFFLFIIIIIINIPGPSSLVRPLGTQWIRSLSETSTLQRPLPTLSLWRSAGTCRTQGIISHKLQALVYDIFPSTTAVFSYAIRSRKLSANEQVFVGALTVVRLLQTTQMISDVCFKTDHVAYASKNKTRIVWIKTELFFTRGGCVSCLRATLLL